MPDNGDLPKPTQLEALGDENLGRTISHAELSNLLTTAARGFTPSVEGLFPQTAGRKRTKRQKIALSSVPNGSVIQVGSLAHPGFFYTLEVTDSTPGQEKDVSVWRSGQCLKGKVSNIITYKLAGNGFQVERGILEINQAMSLPYFKIIDGKVQPPKTSIWSSCNTLDIIE